MRCFIICLWLLITLCSCNNSINKGDNEDLKTNIELKCDFSITGDYYNEEYNFVLSGTSLNLNIKSNIDIDGIVVNDNYYENINNQIGLPISEEGLFNINVSSLLIDDNYYNISFSKTINIVDKLSLLAISPKLNINYTNMSIDVSNYMDLNIPLYMQIRVGSEYIYDGLVTDEYFYFGNLNNYLIDVKLDVLFTNEIFNLYNKSFYLPEALEYDIYDEGPGTITLLINPKDGVVLDSYIFAGNTYPITDTKITLTKPKGLIFDYDLTINYKYGEENGSYNYIVNFRNQGIPNYDAIIEYYPNTTSYDLTFGNLGNIDESYRFEISIYKDDVLIKKSNDSYLEFKEFESLKTYDVVFNLYYFDYVSMEEKVITKTDTFTTIDRYADYTPYQIDYDTKTRTIYISYLTVGYTVTNTKLYYEGNLIEDSKKLVFSNLVPGSYSLDITWETKEGNANYVRTDSVNVMVYPSIPNIINNITSTANSITFSFFDLALYSEIVDFRVDLYLNDEYISSINAMSGTFINLKSDLVYTIVYTYSYYDYSYIYTNSDSRNIITKAEYLYGR